MKEGKMLRILIDLADKKGKDYGVFYLIDAWEVDTTKQVREIITIEKLIEQFTKKEGPFYQKYRITSDFRELEKNILANNEQSIKCFYKDTYDAYMENWKKEHPNEKDYNTWVQKERKKRRIEFQQMLGSFGLFGSMRQYKEIFDDISKF